MQSLTRRKGRMMETVEEIVRGMRNAPSHFVDDENGGCRMFMREEVIAFADRLESAVRQMRRDNDATVVDLMNKVKKLEAEIAEAECVECEHASRINTEKHELEKKIKAVKDICDSVKTPFIGDAMMPTPWEWRASRWGIRDIEIYAADGSLVVRMDECYPLERMTSAAMIPLSVNAIQEIKRLFVRDAEEG